MSWILINRTCIIPIAMKYNTLPISSREENTIKAAAISNAMLIAMTAIAVAIAMKIIKFDSYNVEAKIINIFIQFRCDLDAIIPRYIMMAISLATVSFMAWKKTP